MHNTLLEEIFLSHTLGKEGMKIPFSKEYPVIEKFPIHIEEEEKVGGNIIVISRAYLAPHAEEDGELALTRGIIACSQGVPKDLMCGDQGTIHEHHVSLLIDCETL